MVVLLIGASLLLAAGLIFLSVGWERAGITVMVIAIIAALVQMVI